MSVCDKLILSRTLHPHFTHQCTLKHFDSNTPAHIHIHRPVKHGNSLNQSMFRAFTISIYDYSLIYIMIHDDLQPDESLTRMQSSYYTINEFNSKFDISCETNLPSHGNRNHDAHQRGTDLTDLNPNNNFSLCPLECKKPKQKF